MVDYQMNFVNNNCEKFLERRLKNFIIKEVGTELVLGVRIEF